MSPLVTADGVQGRVWAGYDKRVPIYGNWPAASGNLFNGSGAASIIRRGAFVQGPPASLESGVTAYIPTKIQLAATLSVPFMLCEMFNLGVLDISGASGSFTDGVAAPSRKQLGVTAGIPLTVVAEVETALNSVPGTIAYNYLNQDGNSRSSVSSALTASSVKWSAGFPLMASSGDMAVTDITSCTRAAGTTPTGIVRLWGLSPIYCGLMAPGAGAINVNLLNEGIVCRLGAGAQVGLWAFTNSAIAIAGQLTYVGDN